MYWDDAYSRAVFPSSALAAAGAPVLGTRELASRSPLPYGLGLYQRSEAGAEVGQDMYYVSPEAARARGCGVLPGWYVVVTPGTEFALRLTNVHEFAGGKVWDKPLDTRFGACVEVIVDGDNVLGGICGYQVGPAGEEVNITGFLESETFPAGQRRGNSTVRVFRFGKSRPRPGSVDDEDECTGFMRLRIHSGPLKQSTHLATYRNNHVAPEVGEVDENSASKLDQSVLVERDGTTAYDFVHRAAYSVRRDTMEGEVTVFMRERYWLESRNIIPKDANPLKPRRFLEVINVDNEEEENNDEDEDDDDEIEVVYVKKATAVKQEVGEEERLPGEEATNKIENIVDGELTQVGNVPVEKNVADNSTANVAVTVENARRVFNNSQSMDNHTNPTLDVNERNTISFVNDPESPKPSLQKTSAVGKPEDSHQSDVEEGANIGGGGVKGATPSDTSLKSRNGNEAQSDNEEDCIEVIEVDTSDKDEENEVSANGKGKKRKKADDLAEEIRAEDEIVPMRAKKRVRAEAEAEEGSPTKRAKVAETNPIT